MMLQNELQPGQVLLLSPYEDGQTVEKFYIQKLEGRGMERICYRAVREADGRRYSGWLKEFFPLAMQKYEAVPGFQRKLDGRLFASVQYQKEFQKLRQQALDNGYKINKACSQDPKHDVLRNYIQLPTIYYGQELSRDEQSRSPVLDPGSLHEEYCLPTVYFWYTGIKGITGDEFIKKMEEHRPEKTAEELEMILQLMETLCDAVISLHVAGFVNLDLSPKNYMIPETAEGDLNPNSISIIDITAARKLDHTLRHRGSLYGTEGYAAPELKLQKCTNRSDVYSLGALFYEMFMLTEEKKHLLYREKTSADLSEALEQSVYLSDFPINAPVLKQKVQNILEGALEKSERLRTPSASAMKKQIHECLLWIRKEMARPFFQKNAQKINPRGVIQQFLYEHAALWTRYQNSPRIFLAGDGEEMDTMIDLLLEQLQQPGISGNVEVFCTDPVQRMKTYLKKRPFLPQLADIRVSGKTFDQPYFWNEENEPADNGSHLDNFFSGSDSISDSGSVILDSLSFSQAEVIFHPLEDLNKEIHSAAGCDKIKNNDGENPLVMAYFSQLSSGGLIPDLETYEHILKEAQIPLFIKKPEFLVLSPNQFSGKTIDFQKSFLPDPVKNPLMRAAVMVHSVWEGRNNPFDVAEKLIDDPYCLDSSLSMAASLPVMLHTARYLTSRLSENSGTNKKAVPSIADNEKLKENTMDCLLCCNEEMLAWFSNRAHEEIIEKLAEMEHRRWMVEKACQGWMPLETEEGAADFEHVLNTGKTGDRQSRKHLCLALWDKKNPEKQRTQLVRLSSGLQQAAYLRRQKLVGQLKLNAQLLLTMLSSESHQKCEYESFLRVWNQLSDRLEADLKNNSVHFAARSMPKSEEYDAEKAEKFEGEVRKILESASAAFAPGGYLKDIFDKTGAAFISCLKSLFLTVQNKSFADNDLDLVRAIPWMLMPELPAVIDVYDQGKKLNSFLADVLLELNAERVRFHLQSERTDEIEDQIERIEKLQQLLFGCGHGPRFEIYISSENVLFSQLEKYQKIQPDIYLVREGKQKNRDVFTQSTGPVAAEGSSQAKSSDLNILDEGFQETDMVIEISFYDSKWKHPVLIQSLKQDTKRIKEHHDCLKSLDGWSQKPVLYIPKCAKKASLSSAIASILTD